MANIHATYEEPTEPLQKQGKNYMENMKMGTIMEHSNRWWIFRGQCTIKSSCWKACAGTGNMVPPVGSGVKRLMLCSFPDCVMSANNFNDGWHAYTPSPPLMASTADSSFQLLSDTIINTSVKALTVWFLLLLSVVFSCANNSGCQFPLLVTKLLISHTSLICIICITYTSQKQSAI